MTIIHKRMFYEDEIPVCRIIHWEGKELQDGGAFNGGM
jgi:hypothetical protein